MDLAHCDECGLHCAAQRRSRLLKRAKVRRRSQSEWESGSYASFADDASCSSNGRKAVASEGSAPDLAGRARSAAALAGASAQPAGTRRRAASLEPSSKAHHSSNAIADLCLTDAQQLRGSLLEPHLALSTSADMSRTCSSVLAAPLGQQPVSECSSSGLNPEAHCFLDNSLYQALSGGGPQDDRDCDSSSSASGLSGVSGLSAEADCFSGSGLDEAGPAELSSAEALTACQLEGKAPCSKQTADRAQDPKTPCGRASTELPCSMATSSAAGQIRSRSAGAACSAASPPAAGQAILPGFPARAAFSVPEASSAGLLVRPNLKAGTP